MLDDNEPAQKYLKNNYLDIVKCLSKYTDTDALAEYVNLGLLDEKELQNVFEEFVKPENIEASACVLEQ